jgi:RNA polymerase sigma-70 factor (ECF subfamily)
MIEDPANIPKFEIIYEEYGKMMFRIIFAVLKNKQDSEEALNDTLVKIAKNISEIVELSCEEMEAYLVTLSRNTAIDLYRSFKNNPGKVDFEEVSNTKSIDSLVTQDVLNTLVSEEGYQAILALIGEMKDTYKDVMRLRFINGYSNGKIAEILNLTVTNIETRIGRGRVTLIETLKKEGYYVNR